METLMCVTCDKNKTADVVWTRTAEVVDGRINEPDNIYECKECSDAGGIDLLVNGYQAYPISNTIPIDYNEDDDNEVKFHEAMELAEESPLSLYSKMFPLHEWEDKYFEFPTYINNGEDMDKVLAVTTWVFVRNEGGVEDGPKRPVSVKGRTILLVRVVGSKMNWKDSNFIAVINSESRDLELLFESESAVESAETINWIIEYALNKLEDMEG